MGSSAGDIAVDELVISYTPPVNIRGDKVPQNTVLLAFVTGQQVLADGVVWTIKREMIHR